MRYYYPNKDLEIVSVEVISFEVEDSTLYVNTVEGVKKFPFIRSTLPLPSRFDDYIRHSFYDMWGLGVWIDIPK